MRAQSPHNELALSQLPSKPGAFADRLQSQSPNEAATPLRTGPSCEHDAVSFGSIVASFRGRSIGWPTITGHVVRRMSSAIAASESGVTLQRLVSAQNDSTHPRGSGP